MPQVFQVLKCYKCLVFQVHQTKKSNKFQCKMCGEKQSIKRHYGLGNSLECRKHVQKLNALKGEIDESNCISDDFSDDKDVVVSNKIPHEPHKIKKSKWSDFVDTGDITNSLDQNNDTMYLNDAEVVLELPTKRQKTLSHFIKKSKTLPNSKDYKETTNSPISSQTNDDMSLTSNTCENNEKLPAFKLTKGHADYFISKSDNADNECTIALTQKASHSGSSLLKKEKKTKFLPPPINKNSKWAKFSEGSVVEDDMEELNANETKYEDLFVVNNLLGHHERLLGEKTSDSNQQGPTLNNNNHYLDPQVDKSCKTGSHMIFSLCDDNNIDEFLTI